MPRTKAAPADKPARKHTRQIYLLTDDVRIRPLGECSAADRKRAVQWCREGDKHWRPIAELQTEEA